MKGFFLKLSILLFFTLIFFSCSKNQENQEYSNIEFILDHDSEYNGDNSRLVSNSLTDAVSIMITVYSEQKGINVLKNKTIPVRVFGTTIMTEPMNLELGNYIITDFYVLDKNGEVIFCVPKKNSPLSKYVSQPLDISFNISKDTQRKVICEILPTNFAKSTDFGYSGDFPTQKLDILTMLVAVYLYDNTKKEYIITTAQKISIYGDNKLIYSGSIQGKINEIILKDYGYSNFKISVRKDGKNSDLNYTIKELKDRINTPLIFLYRQN